MTAKDWYEQEDYVASLGNTLRTPEVRAALDVLISEYLPKSCIPGNSENLIERSALLNARREGYFDFYRNLLLLAEPKNVTAANPDSMQPWSYAGE